MTINSGHPEAKRSRPTLSKKQLIRQSKPIADQQFKIEFLESGVEAFAFTFG